MSGTRFPDDHTEGGSSSSVDDEHALVPVTEEMSHAARSYTVQASVERFGAVGAVLAICEAVEDGPSVLTAARAALAGASSSPPGLPEGPLRALVEEWQTTAATKDAPSNIVDDAARRARSAAFGEAARDLAAALDASPGDTAEQAWCVCDRPHVVVALCDDDGIVRRGAMHHGTDYPCTGHAHFGGQHIRCTSPAHASPGDTEGPANKPRPCGCGLPLWSEDAEQEGPKRTEWCPHWCIEEVDPRQIRCGDVFYIEGDLPLAVSYYWAETHADAETGSFRVGTPHRSGGTWTSSHPLPVLRVGMVGRQTLAPVPVGEPADDLLERTDLHPYCATDDKVRVLMDRRDVEVYADRRWMTATKTARGVAEACRNALAAEKGGGR